jgi:hypothetical protein
MRCWPGVSDESNPGDTVEYHVVRDGVAEASITHLFSDAFGDVSLSRYWLTPSLSLQRRRARLGACNTFAIVARQRL